jgi:hypothetical protein
MIKDLIKVFDRRKQQLHSVLATRKGEMDPGKQHQIYGAINELNMVIRTLSYQYEQWLQAQNDVGRLSRETAQDQQKIFNTQLDSLREQPFNRLSDEEQPFDVDFRGDL